MPEVPELLTLKNNLLKRIKNKKVDVFEIRYGRYLNSPQADFLAAFQGATLKDIARSGKTLQLHFSNGQTLGFHLMTGGKPYLLPASKEYRWPVFEMIFTDGTGFAINDATKQTRLSLNPTPPNVPDVLGPDLTIDFLKSLFKKKNLRRPIKSVLTNQNYILGIGNAYVDEILWQAKVSPDSMPSWIPDQKIRDIFIAIQEVLSNGEAEIMARTGKDELLVENRAFMKVHNARRSHDPNGDVIFNGIVDKAKTYWTKSQVKYADLSDS